MLFCALILCGIISKLLIKDVKSIEMVIALIYLITSFFFYFDLLTIHNLSHSSAVMYGGNDDLNCYSPFSEKHNLTLDWFLFAFYFSLLLIWIFKWNLSPIILTLSLIFILIGIVINIVIAVQLSQHDLGILNLYNKKHIGLPSLAVIFNSLIGIYFIYKATTREALKTLNRRYENRFLNQLNCFLAKKSRNPLWLIVLSLPIFFIVTLILILFGQQPAAIVGVFTDTATWRFSQFSFPDPIADDGRGHYLCTVAASGDPQLVKPLRLGKRHGKMIVVNRQLLIANAFEDLIQKSSPAVHRIIRNAYDKYGLDLSKKINSLFWSNFVYLAMKPLEWFFLITLYAFCIKPEEKIDAQYAV